MEPRPISIWRPRWDGGELVFARPRPGPLGDHYADRAVIEQRCPAQRRLCLFGESAAAGYLLAPHLTPAKAVQSYLGPEWDVVDLARTNEGIASLATTIEAAEQLRPDVRVVFAGNNWNLLETVAWSPYFPDGAARRSFGRALAEGGLGEVCARAATELSEKSDDLFDRIAALGGRTIVVVPEVNLADWLHRQPVPWLSGHKVPAWYRHVLQAERCSASSDWLQAEKEARAAMELDQGMCPTALGLLARALDRQGRRDEALAAYRAEVEAVRYPTSTFLAAPQTTTTVRDLLSRACARHGFEMLDLRSVLASSSDEIPGRRWFYDYCHLTPEGIDELAQAVAITVAPGEAGAVDRAGRRAKALPPVRHRALAEIGAAVHGAHRGARGEIVRYWLRRAIATWPGAIDRLLDLVEARASGLPAVLSPGQLRDPFLTPQQGWDWPHLDAEVIAAIIEVLDRPVQGAGKNHAEATAAKAAQERLEAGTRGRIEPWHPLERCFAEVLPEDAAIRRATWQSLWPESDYAWCARRDGPPLQRIELVVRCPDRGAPASVEVSGDGLPLATFRVDADWRRIEIAARPRPGLGRLRLRWPMPSATAEEGLARAVDRLDRELDAHLCPVFGEVFSIRLLD